MLRTYGLKAALSSCLLVSPVYAQSAGASIQTVEALAAQASAAYKAGDYERAVSLYLEAYKSQRAAAVLYNIAIIYDRKLSEPQLASAFYRRYIGAPDADPAAVLRATKRLGELKAAENKVIEKQPEPPPPVQVVEAVEPTHGASAARTVGWSLFGGGARRGSRWRRLWARGARHPGAVQ